MTRTEWNKTMKYPDCYLHVQELRSGETWIVPIKGKMVLDLKTRVQAWIKSQFDGIGHLDGDLMPRLDGDYYAKTMTDERDPDCGICWEGAGFYVRLDEY